MNHSLLPLLPLLPLLSITALVGCAAPVDPQSEDPIGRAGARDYEGCSDTDVQLDVYSTSVTGLGRSPIAPGYDMIVLEADEYGTPPRVGLALDMHAESRNWLVKARVLADAVELAATYEVVWTMHDVSEDLGACALESLFWLSLPQDPELNALSSGRPTVEITYRPDGADEAAAVTVSAVADGIVTEAWPTGN